MKKLITLLMSCSLALLPGAMAQQDDNSPAPKKSSTGHPRKRQRRPRTQDERPAATQNRGMRGQEQRAERHNVRPESNTNENQQAQGRTGQRPTTGRPTGPRDARATRTTERTI